MPENRLKTISDPQTQLEKWEICRAAQCLIVPLVIGLLCAAVVAFSFPDAAGQRSFTPVQPAEQGDHVSVEARYLFVCRHIAIHQSFINDDGFF